MNSLRPDCRSNGRVTVQEEDHAQASWPRMPPRDTCKLYAHTKKGGKKSANKKSKLTLSKTDFMYTDTKAVDPLQNRLHVHDSRRNPGHAEQFGKCAHQKPELKYPQT